MPPRVLIGTVTSDKANKTRRVEITRLVQHPRYKKYVKRRTVCHVHDENNESSLGDKVEIQECPPVSRTKRWRLVRIVEKNRGVDIAALRAARKAVEAEETEESRMVHELASKESSADTAAEQSSSPEQSAPQEPDASE